MSPVKEFTSSQAAQGAEHGANRFSVATRSVVHRLVAALIALLVMSAGTLVVGLPVPAGAQAIPVRVAQGSDGSLYLVQGGNAWLLVPDQLGDEELAALTVGGEVDGILPGDVLTVAAPSLPQAPVTAPPAPADVAPAPLATATAVPTAIPPAAGTPVRRALPTPSGPAAPSPTAAPRGTTPPATK